MFLSSIFFGLDWILASTKKRFSAVLHQGPVDSPKEAVKASIVQVRRNGKI
jgi:hypothetical protein